MNNIKIQQNKKKSEVKKIIVSGKQKKDINYICNSKIDLGKKGDFITIGKGYDN